MKNQPKKPKSGDRIRSLFSQITLLLTIGFGGVTALTLIEEPARVFNPMTSAPVSDSRSPASVAESGVTGTTLEESPDMETLDIGCSALDKLKTSSEHMRIRGQICLKDVTDTQVENTVNGFGATVFHQGETGFTTDFIRLVSGENRVEVRHMLKSGEVRLRHVVIHRE